MTLIHGKGYSDQEKEAFKEIIFSNTVQSMRVILEAMSTMGIELGKAENKQKHALIMDLSNQIEADDLPQDVAKAIVALWADEGVQACFARAREFQINDSAK
jgi:guanine nucleotide-binding protein G(i) subunit alpha